MCTRLSARELHLKMKELGVVDPLLKRPQEVYVTVNNH